MIKKALITGITGQDGAFLAKFLLENGYKVYGTSRDSYQSNYRNLKILDIHTQIEYRSMAINDFRSVLKVIKEIHPTEIYNLAGQSSVGLSFEQPVETFESIAIGTLNILESIKLVDENIKFYNAGSGECFGHTYHPVIEEDKFKPNSPYAVAKSTAYWEVKNYREAYGLYCCTGLLFNHESHLRGNRFVTKKIINTVCDIYKGNTKNIILGNIDISRDWGWAPEYVEAMHMMLQKKDADDFIIASGEVRSLENFLDLAFSYFDLDYREHLVIDKALFRPSDILISQANPIKANAILGWKARYRLENIVEEMIKHELDNLK